MCVCVDVTYIISPSPSSLTIARGARDGREIVRVEAGAVCASVAIVLGREIAGAEREFDGVARGARGGREIARIGADGVCESVTVVLVREIARVEMESDGCVDHRTDR